MYREIDRGYFEACLLRDDTAIAYTDCDCVCITGAYRKSDVQAVEKFAERYDLIIDWDT